MTRFFLICLCLFLTLNLIAPTPVFATEPIFHTRTYNAFTRIFGRPEFFSGSMRHGGTSSASLSFNLVSFAEIERSQDQRIELDGETYEAVLKFDHNVTNRWEIGARIPYLYNSGGFMDDTVDGFHDLFGMPEGDRPAQGQNELLFLIEQAGQPTFLIDDSGGDFGDVQLQTRFLLTTPDASKRQLAIHAGVKLPTGDQENLTGSGATDYSIGLGYSDPRFLAGLRTTLSAHAGVLVLGDGDVLESEQKDTVAFGGVQLAFAATEKITLLAQIQGATDYYDSDLDVLDGSTVQLSFGANIRWPDSGWDWRFGIVEDGLSKVMPDFALHMEVSRSFPRR